MRRLVTVFLLLAVVALVGCGDSETPTTADEGNSDPNQAMVDCLEEAVYDVVKQSPTEFQVKSPAGQIVANIDTFSSQAAAAKFADQLTVDHVAGPRAVAVILAPADDAEARVIADCLQK